MNKQECDILNVLIKEPFVNQRRLSEESRHSLGIVNKSIKNLISNGYLDESMNVTKKAIYEIREKSPKNAIILAAGFGMRMVPINTEYPKGLLEVYEEPLIERLIRQLHDVNIKEIYIVVGFMKEKYEYLIDKYNVELVVNEKYAQKNNIHSLNLVADKISNTYIVPCDIWCRKNPFNKHESYPWYMVTDLVDDDSPIRINRKKELLYMNKNTGGNSVIGIAYLEEETSLILRKRIEELDNDCNYDNKFWEEAIKDKEKMIVPARVVSSEDFFEINTYEQLREIDYNSNHLKTEAINIIQDVFNVDMDDITDITVLKKGMTNRSFLFKCKGKKYIMRIPGEGTDALINRREEAAVYNIISNQGICDNIIYINPDNGYKITEYIENARCCDPLDNNDLKICMDKLRDFHEKKLRVDHEFDVFKEMNFYESLWGDTPSAYRDYNTTKENVLKLKPYIDEHVGEKVLSHIDANADNFLFFKDGDREDVRLIDWEYAGMQDPHIDIAMFCIYSMFNREQIDNLIDIYFNGDCDNETRIKIYCYVSSCGLLWSNWCEYKRNLGIDFGEYSLRQYRYAKDYFKIAQEEISKDKEKVK